MHEKLENDFFLEMQYKTDFIDIPTYQTGLSQVSLLTFQFVCSSCGQIQGQKDPSPLKRVYCVFP